MKKIPLTQGKFALVDDGDFDELSSFKWCTNKAGTCWYPCRQGNLGQSARQGRHFIRMHRQIMGLDYGDKRQVDHINHDGLDNRRCNLRICSRAQNDWNRRKDTQKTTSKYKGVCKVLRNGKYYFWRARIVKNKKEYPLGDYKKETDAARAYDAKAIELFGEFARCNFQS